MVCENIFSTVNENEGILINFILHFILNFCGYESTFSGQKNLSGLSLNGIRGI